MGLRLVVGLGNPGIHYKGSRHNVGFDWVDKANKALGGRWKTRRDYGTKVAEWYLSGQLVWALKPQVYVNRSGQAVAAFALAYGIPPEMIMVVHDDLDLPPGVARLKANGGHGGHNGLRDIDSHLDSRDYLRLRIGIGHPGEREQVTPYVLSRPNRSDREAIEASFEHAWEVFPELVQGEWQAAVNQLHTRA